MVTAQDSQRPALPPTPPKQTQTHLRPGATATLVAGHMGAHQHHLLVGDGGGVQLRRHLALHELQFDEFLQGACVILAEGVDQPLMYDGGTINRKRGVSA